ncbi:MAG: hypothetical protein SVV80_05615 [Planctomycetota bacterium]|nr:hypothetical protein [Planctomycetota bacterium]
MMEWWRGLETVTQWFYGAAVFFSAIFLWQFITSLIGLGGAEDVDMDADADVDVDVHADVDLHPGDIEAASSSDAADSVAAFRLLSIRAILAFLTLFFWAAAMHHDAGKSLTWAIAYGTFWGLGAFVVVALAMNLMRKLAETGNPRLRTCVGTRGTVYLDIPADGTGEARVTVSGVVSHVKARTSDGKPLKAGTPISVTRTLGPTTIEVKPVEKDEQERGEK